MSCQFGINVLTISIVMENEAELQGGGRNRILRTVQGQMAGGLAIGLPNLSRMSERNQKAQKIGGSTVDLISIASNAPNWIAKPLNNVDASRRHKRS